MYQMENAALAVTALEVLRLKCGWSIGALDFMDALYDGLEQMRWDGRMEQVAPGIYVDGAHNDDAICEFVNSVNQIFGDKDIYLLFAVAEDKDYACMVEHLTHLNHLKGVVVTEIDNGRRTDFHEVMEIFGKNWHGMLEGTYNVKEAVGLVNQYVGPDSILICTGSLYLVGHVKEILGGI
jgi:dihydrofolate synthase/folylpolyglutamate synthase